MTDTREYDYSIKKVNIGVKPFTEYRNGYISRQYTIFEIQDLYNNCRAILKSEGFLEEEWIELWEENSKARSVVELSSMVKDWSIGQKNE